MEKETAPEKSLEVLRREIDDLDRQLFSLLAQRMAVVRDIGGMKRAQGLPISDPVREALLKVKLKEFSAGVLEPWHVEELASVILRISRDLQSGQEEE
ncbi:MAG: chorismate mutase [Fidelibacterota bacterium]|nr:MAG: chorismate mutase [Candidatus Neomarinimicrobiota bacterium]